MKIYETHDKAVKNIAGYDVRPGLFDVNGARITNKGINFTIHTHFGTSVELLLFRPGEDEPYAILPFPEAYRIGDVYSMIVFGLNHEDFEYAYRVDGPYNPQKGHLFNKNNILLDPYARYVSGQEIWGKQKTQSYRARVVRDVFDWGDMPQSSKALSELIIYELHIRGFTQHPSSNVINKGTFAGLKEKIPYLKELGINAVELMPIFEFDEMANERQYDNNKLVDYWGYNTVSFFAPNSSYTANKSYHEEGTELKELIKALHENDIEVILDVVFNHTGEGNEQGKNFCFKGLDNKIYYMLTPEGHYYNFSGCGNTLNCNNPTVQQMILECLRYWTINYRIDGFRFDLASILGRDHHGQPMNNPPLLRMLAYDSVLRNVKLIAEAWDAGGLYQVGSFPASKRWAEWNGRYRDSLRGYLKGYNHEAWNVAWSICGSSDLYGGYLSEHHNNYSGYNSCVNFFTCHDGFTLYDLYSYNDKHNLNNGWFNTDGTNNNLSWNCGEEGETDNTEVLTLRYRMMRNACAVLMCSRGAPMFLAGDEFGNTQFGNNNSYCQDNEISWLDWSYLEKNKDLFEFFKFMIAFRKKHKIIQKKLPNAVCGMDGLHAHYIYGEQVENIPQDTRFIGISMAGYDAKQQQDDIIYIAVNTHWENNHITLPPTYNAGSWFLTVNTYGDENKKYYYEEGQEKRIEHNFVIRPRSVCVFVLKKF
ncbi:MAG: hypothetical protein K2P09_06370 [Erysipelotrichales bacterium]|nr:hypothetical protein [Erysipelotrichales bacterium]